MTLLDYSFPVASRAVFDQTIGGDWYDGLTSGIAKSPRLEVAFKFDIIAWGPSQSKRVHVFAPLYAEAFGRIVDLLRNQEEPTWPIWFAEWPLWKSDQSARAREISELLSKAGPAEYAVASDAMFTTLFAAKPLDSGARELLPATYDGIPSGETFAFWKDYLNLSDH